MAKWRIERCRREWNRLGQYKNCQFSAAAFLWGQRWPRGRACLVEPTIRFESVGEEKGRVMVSRRFWTFYQSCQQERFVCRKRLNWNFTEQFKMIFETSNFEGTVIENSATNLILVFLFIYLWMNFYGFFFYLNYMKIKVLASSWIFTYGSPHEGQSDYQSPLSTKHNSLNQRHSFKIPHDFHVISRWRKPPLLLIFHEFSKLYYYIQSHYI